MRLHEPEAERRPSIRFGCAVAALDLGWWPRGPWGAPYLASERRSVSQPSFGVFYLAGHSRILVSDSSARFANGLAPGATLRQFAAVFGQPRVEEAECGLHATFPGRCGLSVWLDMPAQIDCVTAATVADSLSKHQAPAAVRVGRITLFKPDA